MTTTVSYDTAYLKCHYPREYMAALLTSVLDNSTKTAGYIADCRDMGIRLLHPDINASEDKFTVEPDGSGVPVPVSVELTGPRSEVLSRWLETELGVPAERQVWNEN